MKEKRNEMLEGMELEDALMVLAGLTDEVAKKKGITTAEEYGNYMAQFYMNLSDRQRKGFRALLHGMLKPGDPIAKALREAEIKIENCEAKRAALLESGQHYLHPDRKPNTSVKVGVEESDIEI